MSTTHPNSFDTINDLCFYFYNTLQPGEQYSADILIHNNQMTFNIYRFNNLTINDETTMEELFSECTALDAPTQVLLGRVLRVEEGCRLQPPFRCKGLVLYFKYMIQNAGIISMSARGAIGTPIDIYLYSRSVVTDGVPTVEYDVVPAQGAAGRPAQYLTSSPVWNGWGLRGIDGTGRQTGAGGSGATMLNANVSNKLCGASTGGTCYGGGCGGGTICVMNNGTISAGYANATSTRGGNAWNSYKNTWESQSATLGGTGFTCGAHVVTSISAANVKGVYKYNGVGGLLILFTGTLDNTGIISADAAYMSSIQVCVTYTWNFVGSGGGAGGGSVNVFAGRVENRGTIRALGSIEHPNRPATFVNSRNTYEVRGGLGGNGTVTISDYKVTRFLVKDTDIKYYENNKWFVL